MVSEENDKRAVEVESHEFDYPVKHFLESVSEGRVKNFRQRLVPGEPIQHRSQQGGQDEQSRRRKIDGIPGQILSPGLFDFREKPVAENDGPGKN